MSFSDQNMPKCIFCDGELDGNTKPEHVLLNALGGRMTTRLADCSKCNNFFGGGIDKAFADQVTEIRNLLQLESGSGRTAPSLKGIKAGDQVLNLSGDGRIDLVTKPFTIEKNADGTSRLNIHARSVEEIDRLIPNIAAALKMPEAALRQQMSGVIASVTEKRPNMIHFPLSFGGPDAFRSAVKSCMVLWATCVGNEELHREPYRAMRDFVMRGDDGLYRTHMKLDTRPSPQVEATKQAYGPVFNSIYVRSDASGRVIGHFTLYNIVGFQAVLAESGGVPDRQIALLSDPRAPQIWSLTGDLDIPFTWLETPQYDVAEVRQRVADFATYYVESGRSEEIGRIIEDAIKKNGIREGEAIPASLAHKLGGEIAQRVAKHEFGLPHIEAVSLEQLRANAEKEVKPDGLAGPSEPVAD